MAIKKYINGYDKPKFIIYDGLTYVKEIELRLCDEDGLTEEYEFLYIEHNMLNYSQEKLFKGYHIHFNLSYKSWSDATNTIKIRDLINYILLGYKILLYPRKDDYRVYEVNYTGDTFTLNIMKMGERAIGNTGIELNFRTKYKQSTLDWTNPNDSRLITIDNFIAI